MWVKDEFGWVDIHNYKVTGTFECIIKSDDENIEEDIKDWVNIDDDIDDYIKGFKIEVTACDKIKENDNMW